MPAEATGKKRKTNGFKNGKGNNLKKLAKKYPHLKDHLKWFKSERSRELPDFVENPEAEGKKKDNILYKVDDIVFIHTHAESEENKRYYAIEPRINKEEKEVYRKIRDEIFNRSISSSKFQEEIEENELREVFEEVVPGPNGKTIGLLDKIRQKNVKTFELSEKTRHKLWYRLKKEIIGLGPLEPLLKDRLNEDIHVLGYDSVEVDHKVYGIMETNVDLGSSAEYKSWLKSLTERIGSPISDSDPIIDSTLPDGSRLNIVYSDDISVEGPTLTIRQFEEEPLSLFEIVKFGTMSPELVAYLWLALESNASVAVCGETASGKTTSMNAMSVLIPEESKIYSAEDTLEVRPPHETWQRLLTKEGPGGGADVDLYNLLTNALRSRPDYILVGEVRGREAQNVFTAMQTGHPCIFTFHAGNISSLINRFTGEPINIPEKFFNNLNIAIFQNFIKRAGEDLRRITEVHEIEGYSEAMNGIISRKIFERNLVKEETPSGETKIRDRIDFIGYNNSYFLEEKAAPTLGYSDPRDIYGELDKRAKIVEKALEKEFTDYNETLKVIRSYEKKGEEGLPFEI